MRSILTILRLLCAACYDSHQQRPLKFYSIACEDAKHTIYHARPSGYTGQRRSLTFLQCRQVLKNEVQHLSGCIGIGEPPRLATARPGMAGTGEDP